MHKQNWMQPNKPELKRRNLVNAFTLLALSPWLFCACIHHYSKHVTYSSPYHEPLITPGTKFAALPPVVQQTIRVEAGTQEIADIIKDARRDRVVYHVYFSDSQVYPPLFIGMDGSILNPDLTVAMAVPRNVIGVLGSDTQAPLSPADLPEPVARALRARAPGMDVQAVSKENYGTQAAYIITFKNRRLPSLRIMDDGTVSDEK
jgi:hypothetical protein